MAPILELFRADYDTSEKRELFNFGCLRRWHDWMRYPQMVTQIQHENEPTHGFPVILWHAKYFGSAHEAPAETEKTQQVIQWYKMA